MSELGRFQDAFSAALTGDAAPLAPWTHPDAAGLAVYRNTIAKGLADALAAQFPTVARAAGAERMRAAALAFAREQPPRSPALHAYGEAFPDWLARFPPAAEAPWLAGLARIDWAYRDALFAPDAEPLAAGAVAALAPDAYAEAALELHPSAVVLWFEDGAPSLWRALQADPPPAAAELAAEAEGMLLVRPGLEVLHRALSRGACAFLEACRTGDSLAAAGDAALAAEPDLPLSALFADLIGIGAFGRIRRLAAAVG